MQKLRPRTVHQIIYDQRRSMTRLRGRFDLATMAGNPLHRAIRFSPTLANIKQHQFTHAWHSVMSTDDPHKHARLPWNRPGIEQGIGPVGIAAIELHLFRTVGIHTEQHAVVTVWCIGVLPSQIHHTTALLHSRTPVVFLVETELTDRTIRFHAIEICDARAAVHTWHSSHGGG